MASTKTPARDALLAKYLNEAYGKEQQLETALQAQIGIAGRKQLKDGLRDHLKVTKAQSRALKKRIKQLGATAVDGPDLPGPDVVTDVAAAATSVANKAMSAAKGPLQALRGTSPEDNDLRLVRDCLWNEAEEIAHYDVIETVAESLNDTETAKLARAHRRQEEQMQRLLQRQLKPLVTAVVKAEVPSSERPRPTRRTKPAASARSASSARSSASKPSTTKPGAASKRSSTTKRSTSKAS